MQAEIYADGKLNCRIYKSDFSEDGVYHENETPERSAHYG